MLKGILILANLAVVVGMSCKATRAGYESAPYKVLRHDGAVEVRDYPSWAFNWPGHLSCEKITAGYA